MQRRKQTTGIIIILIAAVLGTAFLAYNFGIRSERARIKRLPISKSAVSSEKKLQTAKPQAARPQEKKPVQVPVAAAIPAVAKKTAAPKIAIVMDDLGYNVNELEDVFAIKEPITFSILPNLKFSEIIAREAREKGYEVILHLPLESERKDVKEEAGTIRSGMSEGSVLEMLEKNIGSVPYLAGVSNHMGSKATTDEKLMETIMAYLKTKKLYFLDSFVTEKTVCPAAAAKSRIRFAMRDVFLDNSSDEESIKKALQDLRAIALKKGWAIGICHYRKNTIKVLASVMPDFAASGVRLVYLSELVK